MELVKPEPLIIAGRAHYTLTSYEPVTVEVEVPYTSEEDVEYALEGLIAQTGATPENLQDGAWLKENFDVCDLKELRQLVFAQIQAMNADMSEQQKADKCAAALAQRLVQAVPADQISRYVRMVSETLKAQLAQAGNTVERFCLETGLTRTELEQMFYEQARLTAENEAALEAWAENRKLTVADEELPRLLGLPPQEASAFLAEASSRGQLDDIRRAGLRSKALEIVVAECNCTYVHETPSQAAQRVREARARDAEFFGRLADNETASGDEHPHLKLV